VRREDLYSPSSSSRSTPDPELEQLFRDRIQLEFSAATEFDTSRELGDTAQGADVEEEVEFRLFAPSSKATTNGHATKIRIRSPSVDNRPPGLIQPERAREYYFRDSLSPEAGEKLQVAAVSGEEVLARSKTPCPGRSLPWRVTTIAAEGTALVPSNLILPDQSDTMRKKKRKGKKARIAIRQKIAEDREKREKEKQAAAEKELADKIKKAKRNREKKLKKRARDKLKAKLADGEIAKDDLPGNAGDSSDGSQSD
jgi:hypothetical protein